MLNVPRRAGLARPATVSRAGRIIARRHALKTNHERPRSGLVVRALATVIAAFGITSAFAVAMTAVIGATAVGVLSVDLPDPKRLDTLTFDQPTVVLDRTGKVELTRFQRVQRRVVTYDQVPRLVLDSATTAEDRTFWTNGGFDGTAILSAIAEGASGGDQRGASTITQQLVRARLLPEGGHRTELGPLHPQGQGADPGHPRHRGIPGRRPASSRSSRPI